MSRLTFGFARAHPDEVTALVLVEPRHAKALPQAVFAPDSSIDLAGEEGQANRLRHPPALEEFGLRPRLENDARGAVHGSRDDDLTVRLPLHRRAVLHRVASLSLLAFIDLLLVFEIRDNLVQLVEA